MVLVSVYVRLFRFIDELFNFGINNVVEKPINDKGLFNILKFVKDDSYSRYADDILLTISLMKLRQYKRLFKIFLFSILHKKSTSIIKLHF